VKCDELRPRCQNCIRVDRICAYLPPSTPTRGRTVRASSFATEPSTEILPSKLSLSPDLGSVQSEADVDVVSLNILQPWDIFSRDQITVAGSIHHTNAHSNPLLVGNDIIPSGDIFPPNLDVNTLGPLEWYDLLAQDAITNIEEHNASALNQEQRWNFDICTLSRRQTPWQSHSSTPAHDVVAAQNQQLDGNGHNNLDFTSFHAHSEATISTEPWNTATRIELGADEVVFFKHYVTTVGPILDLFDPAKHFSNTVSHLALQNVGLLKSLLAVGACHMALYTDTNAMEPCLQLRHPSTPASVHSTPIIKSTSSRIAEQYYYETLHYLAQNLLYPSYTCSHEILATAIMISTYEMYSSPTSNGNWGRHLKGAFWIQRSQDNDGESSDGLRQAVWWAWLRQDIWAAFREGRPAMTIWSPKKPLQELRTDEELCTRVVYVAAKCVQFAASRMAKGMNIQAVIEKGEDLLGALEAWKKALPPSFEPIPIVEATLINEEGSGSVLKPVWIHPPANAAAIQTYHFSRIVVLLNQPSTGGLNKYQARGRMLRESMGMICGIAVAQQSQSLPSAFVSFQAVYAGKTYEFASPLVRFTNYEADHETAALCAETCDKQNEVMSILRDALNISKFPMQSMFDDLAKLWGR
jgi:hypothetical protein